MIRVSYPPARGLVAELVDAVDSKSTGLAHLGSTPSEATTRDFGAVQDMFRAQAEAIAASAPSVAMQNTAWLVPVSQSLHIMAMSVLFAAALFINFRLLGLVKGGRSVSQLVTTLVPWMWRALAVCLVTGTVQTITEPLRQFVTPLFWCKLLLIGIMALLTWLMARAVRRSAGAWDASATRPAVARWFGLLSTVTWLAVIACGRFIGYVWTYYL